MFAHRFFSGEALAFTDSRRRHPRAGDGMGRRHVMPRFFDGIRGSKMPNCLVLKRSAIGALRVIGDQVLRRQIGAALTPHSATDRFGLIASRSVHFRHALRPPVAADISRLTPPLTRPGRTASNGALIHRLLVAPLPDGQCHEGRSHRQGQLAQRAGVTTRGNRTRHGRVFVNFYT